MCHVSVGHVARVFEERGLATVAVYVEAFAHYARSMSLPRVVITPHPMGRPIGPPGNHSRQSEVVDAALTLLDTATTAGATRLVIRYDVESNSARKAGRYPRPRPSTPRDA